MPPSNSLFLANIPWNVKNYFIPDHGLGLCKNSFYSRLVSAFMESRFERTEIVRVKLPNGKEVKIEARFLGGEENVSAKKILLLDDLTDVLDGVVLTIADSLQKVQPTKATVKLGLEVALESGQLTTLIVKGSGKANLEATLEWQKQDMPTPKQIPPA